MGRHYIQNLLKSDPIINETTLNEMRYKQTLGHSSRLRINGKTKTISQLYIELIK